MRSKARLATPWSSKSEDCEAPPKISMEEFRPKRRRLELYLRGSVGRNFRDRGYFAETGEVQEMDEREFFNETTETRTHNLTCPKCGQAGEYKVTWVVRRKRPQLPRHADERDRAKFAKAQSYMVRRDDKLSCMNIRCRKPFEITSLQSLAFLNE